MVWGELFLWAKHARKWESSQSPKSKFIGWRLEGEERFLADVHWPRGKFWSPINQAFMENRSLSS